MKTAPKQPADGVRLVENVISTVVSWPTATVPGGVYKIVP